MIEIDTDVEEEMFDPVIQQKIEAFWNEFHEAYLANKAQLPNSEEINDETTLLSTWFQMGLSLMTAQGYRVSGAHFNYVVDHLAPNFKPVGTA